MEKPLTKSFNIIAHGGASGYAPQNTLAAFQKGLELGANMLELDVQLSKDAEVVAFHDQRLEHTTNGSGYLKDHTVKELKQLDAGKLFETYRGEQIPTLQEVFDLAKGKAKFALDVKNGPVVYPAIEEKIVALVEKNDLVEDVIVISFFHPTLKKVKTLNPTIQTGIVYNAGLLEPWTVAATVSADALHPKYVYPMGEIIPKAHKRGYPVNAWTIDEADEIAQWISYGVDGIASNYPDIVYNTLHTLHKK